MRRSRRPALGQLRPDALRNAWAITPYPTWFACWFGPRGGLAHAQVHCQIRATLRGTVPTPGTATRLPKSEVSKASNTFATRTPEVV